MKRVWTMAIILTLSMIVVQAKCQSSIPYYNLSFASVEESKCPDDIFKANPLPGKRPVCTVW